MKRQRLSHDLRRLPRLNIAVEGQPSVSRIVENVDQLILAVLVHHPSRIGAEVVRKVVFFQRTKPKSEAYIHEEAGHEDR